MGESVQAVRGGWRVRNAESERLVMSSSGKTAVCDGVEGVGVLEALIAGSGFLDVPYRRAVCAPWR